MRTHDEVCGMTIESDEAAASMRFQGKSYFFCTDRCLLKFKEHPGWYVSIERSADDPSGTPAGDPEGAS